MSTLVAFASKYGSTREIAERIAARLKAAGQEVDLRPVGSGGPLAAYDAFVIGSAVYMFKWLKPAARFVERNRALLAARPVWLFSVGPLGPRKADVEKPRDFGTLSEMVDARDHHLFYGALDLSKLRGADRLFSGTFKSAQGDFRDWDEIESWADGIALDLAPAPGTGSRAAPPA